MPKHFALFSLFVFVSCSSQPLLPLPSTAPSNLKTPLDSDFAASESILSGFDALCPDNAWGKGDRTLYGLRLIEEEKKTILFIELKVETGKALTQPDPADPTKQIPIVEKFDFSLGLLEGKELNVHIESKLIRIEVSVFNEKGEFQGKSIADLPEAFLRRGFFEACEISTPQPGVTEKRTLNAQVLGESIQALFAFTQIIQGNPQLEPILRRVIQTPSVLSVLFHLGVKIGVMSYITKAVRTDCRLGDEIQEEALAFPVEFLINKEPALYFQIVCIPPKPPLQLCAGIIGIEGQNPAVASKKFSMRLLAARRGSRD